MYLRVGFAGFPPRTSDGRDSFPAISGRRIIFAAIVLFPGERAAIRAAREVTRRSRAFELVARLHDGDGAMTAANAISVAAAQVDPATAGNGDGSRSVLAPRLTLRKTAGRDTASLGETVRSRSSCAIAAPAPPGRSSSATAQAAAALCR